MHPVFSHLLQPAPGNPVYARGRCWLEAPSFLLISDDSFLLIGIVVSIPAPYGYWIRSLNCDGYMDVVYLTLVVVLPTSGS